MANSTALVTLSSTHSRLWRSLCSIWMSDDDIEIATASTPQSIESWMSLTTARFHPRMLQLRSRAAICVMASFSAPPIVGMPASIW